MSDPRFTDQRSSDPRFNEPVLRSEARSGGIWGWIAGLGVVALIAFIIIAGWNSSDTTTANNGPAMAPITTGNAPVRNVTPPSTTGSGATSPAPQPLSPNSGTR